MIIKFIISIIICQSVGIFGSLFTFEAIPVWYVTLEKPFFAPPNWIFGPVWITLYFLMGVSLYLVLKDETKSKTRDAFFHSIWNSIDSKCFLVLLVFWIKITSIRISRYFDFRCHGSSYNNLCQKSFKICCYALNPIYGMDNYCFSIKLCNSGVKLIKMLLLFP